MSGTQCTAMTRREAAIMSKFQNSKISHLYPAMMGGIFIVHVASAMAPGAQPNGMVNAGIVETSDQRSRPSSLGRTGMTLAPEDFDKLTLAPGYVLQMGVFDAPEMSREIRIDERGDVTIPLLGSVHLGDKTLA